MYLFNFEIENQKCGN